MKNFWLVGIVALFSSSAYAQNLESSILYTNNDKQVQITPTDFNFVTKLLNGNKDSTDDIHVAGPGGTSYYAFNHNASDIADAGGHVPFASQGDFNAAMALQRIIQAKSKDKNGNYDYEVSTFSGAGSGIKVATYTYCKVDIANRDKTPCFTITPDVCTKLTKNNYDYANFNRILQECNKLRDTFKGIVSILSSADYANAEKTNIDRINDPNSKVNNQILGNGAKVASTAHPVIDYPVLAQGDLDQLFYVGHMVDKCRSLKDAGYMDYVDGGNGDDQKVKAKRARQ